MKKKNKIILFSALVLFIAMFCISNYSYADAIDPMFPTTTIRQRDVDNNTLIGVIIVLLTIILLMGVIILKFLYNKYKLEIKITKRNDGQVAANSVSGASADFTDSENFKEELGEKVLEEVEKANNSNDENIKLEIDMSKLFAVMLLIVGILIIIAVLS